MKEQVNAYYKRFKEIHEISDTYHALMALVRHILRPVINWEKILVFEKEISEKPFFQKKQNVKFIDFDKNSIGKIGGFDVEALDLDYVRKRASMGDIFNLVIDNDDEKSVLGYGFLNLEHLGLSEIEIRMGEKFMYSHESFIMPQARGKRLHPSLLEHKTSVGYRQGRERCLLDIFHYNKSSIRGVSKAGFRKIGCVRSYALFRKWKILIYQTSLLDHIQGIRP